MTLNLDQFGEGFTPEALAELVTAAGTPPDLDDPGVELPADLLDELPAERWHAHRRARDYVAKLLKIRPVSLRTPPLDPPHQTFPPRTTARPRSGDQRKHENANGEKGCWPSHNARYPRGYSCR